MNMDLLTSASEFVERDDSESCTLLQPTISGLSISTDQKELLIFLKSNSRWSIPLNETLSNEQKHKFCRVMVANQPRFWTVVRDLFSVCDYGFAYPCEYVPIQLFYSDWRCHQGKKLKSLQASGWCGFSSREIKLLGADTKQDATTEQIVSTYLAGANVIEKNTLFVVNLEYNTITDTLLMLYCIHLRQLSFYRTTNNIIIQSKQAVKDIAHSLWFILSNQIEITNGNPGIVLRKIFNGHFESVINAANCDSFLNAVVHDSLSLLEELVTDSCKSEARPIVDDNL